MRLTASFLLAILVPALALAHHGGAEYDLTKTVEFKGKLTGVDMINPHSWIYFDVTEKDGKVSHHRCEMRSVHVLRRSGWTKERFPVGQQITVEASPNKTDPDSCYLQTIVSADGTRMDRYGQYIKAPQGGVQEVRGPIVATKVDRPLRRPSGEPNISGDWAPVQLVMVNPKGTGGGISGARSVARLQARRAARRWRPGTRRAGRAAALRRQRTDGGRSKGRGCVQA